MGAVFVQLACVFAALSSPRYQRWTPIIAGVLLAVFIAGLAQTSGAGFNPIRGMAPDVLAGTYPALWVYFAGPVIGAATAALAVRLYGRQPLTGKLCHDPTIPCQMRCVLPHTDDVARQSAQSQIGPSPQATPAGDAIASDPVSTGDARQSRARTKRDITRELQSTLVFRLIRASCMGGVLVVVTAGTSALLSRASGIRCFLESG